MRVGFESNILRRRRTGISNYCFNILSELSNADSEIQLLSAEVGGWKEISIKDPALESIAPDKSGLTSFIKSNLVHVPGSEAIRRKLVARFFQLANKPQAIDLFHAFNYIPPFDLTTPTLPVVYDLSFVRYPQMHPKERVRRLSKLPDVIERASLVHTISEFSKREICEAFGCPQQKVFVAYPAAAPVFRPLNAHVTREDLKRLDLALDRYLLAVGTLEPRKNLETLIFAYSNLSKSERARFPLVIVGGPGWGKTNFPENTDKLVSEGSIRFLGFISDSVLRSLYEGARLMLYPSIYEGFGMPVVEAMSCGAEVAHSSNTSMDEITNASSDRVEALDVDAWTRCMREKISTIEPLTADRRQSLIDRAHVFNWSNSARIVRQAYDTILGH